VLRRKKRGFAVNVVDEWFRRTMKSGFDDIFQDRSSEIYRLLKPNAVRDLVAAHQSGQRDHHKLLFSLVVCETLMRLSKNQPLQVGQAVRS
jgi:asparagine synthase (glutamine-hydrolysing)